MGSASREALETARPSVAALGADGAAVGEQLLTAARTLAGSAPLRAALADASADPAAKLAVVTRVFAPSFARTTVEVLSGVVVSRWSSAAELVDGVEELGIRAVAAAAPRGTGLELELFTVGRALRSDADLELAITSKLGRPEAKVALVDRLLANAAPETRTIIRHLVQVPRGRRIGELLRSAERIVADQSGAMVATVTAATRLSTAQVRRLEGGLERRYGRKIVVNQVIDPSVVGGLRIALGDDVIDGSVASRLHDLRLQLAR